MSSSIYCILISIQSTPYIFINRILINLHKYLRSIYVHSQCTRLMRRTDNKQVHTENIVKPIVNMVWHDMQYNCYLHLWHQNWWFFLWNSFLFMQLLQLYLFLFLISKKSTAFCERQIYLPSNAKCQNVFFFSLFAARFLLNDEMLFFVNNHSPKVRQ